MAFGFTKTLPTIAGSHSDFSVLFKTVDFPSAAIDGTSDALNNGGGNLTAYTSDAKSTQLPVEVVRCVSSGSPSIEVWVRVPSVATGATIYIEADDVQTSQPATTHIYGRDAVWSDYLAVLHLVESGNGTTGEYIDSTGNGYDSTGGGGVSGNTPTQTTTDHPWGGTWNSFDGSNDYITIPTASDLNSSYMSVQAMTVIDSVPSQDAGLISNRWSTQGNNFFQFTPRGSGNGTLGLLDDGSGGNGSRGNDPASGSDYWYAFTTASGSVKLVRNGNQEANDTSIAGDNQITTTLDTRIGTYFDGSSLRSLDAKIGEVRILLGTLSVSRYLVEYNNQSSSSAWGTVGTWADAGGGGSFKPYWALNRSSIINSGIS
jgi:hypothetical protein